MKKDFKLFIYILRCILKSKVNYLSYFDYVKESNLVYKLVQKRLLENWILLRLVHDTINRLVL